MPLGSFTCYAVSLFSGVFKTLCHLVVLTLESITKCGVQGCKACPTRSEGARCSLESTHQRFVVEPIIMKALRRQLSKALPKTNIAPQPDLFLEHNLTKDGYVMFKFLSFSERSLTTPRALA